jgi:hypothetical protein
VAAIRSLKDQMKNMLSGSSLRRTGRTVLIVGAWSLALTASLAAQGPNNANAGRAPATARATAPADFTGYWASIVTENWRWRMMVPDKSDYVNVPLNLVGRQTADAWDLAKDKAGDQCKGYGAAALMNVPGRLHISWQDDNTLRIDTDSGTQTRLLHFVGSAPANEPASRQGYSLAGWGDPSEPIDIRGGGGGPSAQGGPEHPEQDQPNAPAAPRSRAPRDSYIRVVTTHMLPGYLRKNGVPYGAGANLEEYIVPFAYKNDSWLMMTIVVTDPQYLIEPFISQVHFKKIADNAGWDPTPCRADESR